VNVSHQLVALCGVVAVVACCLLAESPVSQATFPGPNGAIAFTKRLQGEKPVDDIFIIGPNGQGERNLTNSESGGNYNPDWSADGTRLAFERLGDIFTTDARGGNLRNLTDDIAVASSPAWSPDGSRIAFVSQEQLEDRTQIGIYLMNPDGSSKVSFTPRGLIAKDLVWSPDGRKIAFTRSEETTTSGSIFILDLETNKQHELASGIPFVDPPSWSPDGALLTFARDGDIWLVEPDGSGLTNLTKSGLGELHPEWSPDGEKLVFESYEAGSTYIFLMNADGTRTRITETPGGGSDFDWGTNTDYASLPGVGVSFGKHKSHSGIVIYLLTGVAILTVGHWFLRRGLQIC
jgi:TolB protein